MDVLLSRVPHYELSLQCMVFCGKLGNGYITSTQTKDILFFREEQIF